jgi:hypothetical protein
MSFDFGFNETFKQKSKEQIRLERIEEINADLEYYSDKELQQKRLEDTIMKLEEELLTLV